VPLINIFRLWCDAKNIPAVRIEKARAAIRVDTVVVDLSPLRLPSDGELRRLCTEIAKETSHMATIQSAGQPPEGMIIEDHSTEEMAIWNYPEAALRFECIERKEAKELARNLTSKLQPIAKTLGLVRQLPKEFRSDSPVAGH